MPSNDRCHHIPQVSFFHSTYLVGTCLAPEKNIKINKKYQINDLFDEPENISNRCKITQSWIKSCEIVIIQNSNNIHVIQIF